MPDDPPHIAWQNRSLGGPGDPSRPKQGAAANHPARVPAGTDESTDTSASSQSMVDSDESDEQRMARLLAVLFLAKEPLNSRKLSQYSRLADGTAARTLVNRLNRELDAHGRSFRVESVAGGYQMVTRTRFAKWLRRLEYVPGEVRLSAPAMETLAVVAYRQPVLRVDVEAVRGVSCGEILSQLLSRDLVRIGGRSTELGRPYLYNTTKRFLQLFGLRSLEDLPRYGMFQNDPETMDDATESTDETTEDAIDTESTEEN